MLMEFHCPTGILPKTDERFDVELIFQVQGKILEFIAVGKLRGTSQGNRQRTSSHCLTSKCTWLSGSFCSIHVYGGMHSPWKEENLKIQYNVFGFYVQFLPFNHWLPTLVSLAKRGVSKDGFCPRCHHRFETMVHALWGCRAVATIRGNFSQLKALNLSDNLHFHEFMLCCLRSLSSPQMELICVVFWRIWFCRNRLVHDLDHADSGDVVLWASNFLDEWKLALHMGPPNLSSNAELAKWKPPGRGVWKINSDAATCHSLRKIGLGIVIRDSSGSVKAAGSFKEQAMFSALAAEAMAVWRGILLQGSCLSTWSLTLSKLLS
ncbi:hypothetical protein LWI29_004739 [Acer saccharum]|uniref:RNase H type-1 domain-containing protein n=1 Tax=Acer saccharum TaxID=4024 RepID=A0AA39SUD2_ACESA|nr:hypothetical protein LWI29_004739 [Acer saccharum]